MCTALVHTMTSSDRTLPVLPPDLLHVYETDNNVTPGSLGRVQHRRRYLWISCVCAKKQKQKNKKQKLLVLLHVYKQKDNVIVGCLARVYKQKTTLPLDLLHVYKTENNFAGISSKRREDNVTLGSLGHVRNIRKVNFCLDVLHVYEGEDSVTT